MLRSSDQEINVEKEIDFMKKDIVKYCSYDLWFNPETGKHRIYAIFS